MPRNNPSFSVGVAFFTTIKTSLSLLHASTIYMHVHKHEEHKNRTETV